MEETTTKCLELTDIEGALPSLDDLEDGTYGQSEFQWIKNDLVGRGFENINEIESGSSGTVFSANKDSKPFAIKIISLKNNLRQYKRELNITKSKLLSRDYIVGYFDHWPDCIDNADYLSIQMELCWRSLNTIILTRRDLIKNPDPPRFYQIVFPQVLKGLSEIHSIGWVHRDIHPGNILIVRPFKRIHDVHVKIADFGNAKEIESIMEASGEETVSAEPTFVLPYDSPEERDPSRRYDYKIDLFLAGLVLRRISGFNPDALSKPFIHQDDDILADLLRRLTKDSPRLRPKAKEALEFAWKERKFTVELRTSKDASRHSCVTLDNTIHSFKAVINDVINRAIKSDPPVPLGSQLLLQKKITDGLEELIDITSNEHVKRMFEQNEDVFIVVSLETSELSRNYLAYGEV